MQRVIAVITFFILITGGYYWFIIDESRTNQMIELESSDESLKGDYNATTEKYDRFDLRLIGHGNHLKTLQDETHAHYVAYIAQMDSIDIVFEEIKFSIEQLEEVLTRKIDRLKDDVNNLEDSFESYKRTTNRAIRELKQKISTIQDDINTLNEKVFPPAEENGKKGK